jgi:NO-binding membrane sensor protein with MHYT domain
VVSVDNFTYGLLNPALAYAMSCVGGYLGLRCVTLARAYTGMARARWLCLAAVAIGAVGIWAMHFIAMLGFTVPGEPILYNVPLTVGSMLLAVAVVGTGLFIVGFGDARASDRRVRDQWMRLLAGGVIVGIGVAAMHYMGMAAMSMPGRMSYNVPLVILSVVIAVVAGTAALWIGTWVRGSAATVGAALVMGVAVSGMHYTGMAALRVHGGPVPSMAVRAVSGAAVVSGATAASFLIPVLLVTSLATFLLTLAISVSPSADEVRADTELRRRTEYLDRRQMQYSMRMRRRRAVPNGIRPGR